MAGDRRSVTYRCRECKVKRSGPPGLLCCRDCGGELRELYAVPDPIVTDVAPVDGEDPMSFLFGKKPR